MRVGRCSLTALNSFLHPPSLSPLLFKLLVNLLHTTLDTTVE